MCRGHSCGDLREKTYREGPESVTPESSEPTPEPMGKNRNIMLVSRVIYRW